MATPRVPSGRRIHYVLVQNPSGAAAPDSDGVYVQAYVDGSPASWKVSIEPATARDLERITAGTVIAQASHVVDGAYRSDVTTGSRLVFNGRILNVLGVANPEERNLETVAVCSEVVA